MLLNRDIIFIFFAFLAILFAFTFSFSTYWQEMSNYSLPDSDDMMRVLRVREWLSGQAFYDNFEHRSNAPNGASIHWSRIADLPLLLFQIIAEYFTNAQNAEILSLIFVPILTGLVFIIILGKTASNLANSKLSFFYALVLVPIIASSAYNFQIGRVDHHGLQAICILGIFYGITKNNNIGGIITGFSLALSIAIGFEALIIEALFVMSIFLLWLLQSQKYQQFIFGFCIALNIGIIAGFFTNNSPQDYLIIRNDFQSIGQTILIFFGATYFAIMAKYANNLSIQKKLIIAFLGLVIFLLILFQFKTILKPTYYQISPILTELWLNKIGEIKPLLKLENKEKIAILLPTIVAFLLVISKINISDIRNEKQANWFILAIMIIATAIMTFFYQNRFNIHLGIFILIALCASLPTLLSIKSQKIIIGFLLLILPLKIIYTNFETKNNNLTFAKKCNSKSDFSSLNSLPKGLIAANIDINVPILLNTQHNVMGTAFHRD